MDRRSFLALLTAFGAGAAFGPRLAEAAADSGAPLQIVVSLAGQSLAVYRGHEEIAASNVSTGRKGHVTPTGIFSVLDKRTFHRSNIYSNAPMPFMQRLTWSGIALHASNHVPRQPASHGCVRMPDPFARKLYGMTGFHDHVVIAGPALRPRPLAHSTLFQPVAAIELLTGGGVPLRLNPLDSAVEVASAEGGAQIMNDASAAEPGGPLRLLVTRRTHNEMVRDAQRALNTLGFGAGAVDGFAGPVTLAALRAFQREAGMPATGMFTRDVVDRLHSATGRAAPTAHLYARRGFKPLFDRPATLRAPERPMGTHLATISGLGPGGADWAALSLPDRPGRSVRDGFGMTTDEIAQGAPPLSSVLDRIEIDDETRRRIAPLLTAGASLAVSDNGLGPETGRGTDFIALTRE